LINLIYLFIFVSSIQLPAAAHLTPSGVASGERTRGVVAEFFDGGNITCCYYPSLRIATNNLLIYLIYLFVFFTIQITVAASCIELPKNRGKTRSQHTLSGLFATK